MKEKQKNRTGTMLLVMLSIALAIQGCGSSSTETMPVGSGAVLSASTPTAGVSTCVNCHTQVAADWLTTRHANRDAPGDDSSVGSPAVAGIATCTASCHDRTGDSSNITVAGTIGDAARPVVGCEACHGPGSLHANAGGMGPISRLSNGSAGTVLGSGPTVTVSGMFVTCTSCHELLKSDGTLTVAVHDGSIVEGGTGGTQYAITDTHSAVSNSWSNSNGANNMKTGQSITGYSMDFSRDRVCADCHNPHKTAAINREWAQSAHADRYGTNTADPSGFFKGAWAYYNWSCDGSSKIGCGENTTTLVPNSRRACQRCHTTSGFSDYADALRSSDLETAEAISAGTVTIIQYDPGFKPEMLKCDGCHLDNRGTLRNPGPITANYDLSMRYPTAFDDEATYAKASHKYPDVAASNVCMACHTSRESGDTIKNLNTSGVPGVNFANETLAFVNSHYLGAGGMVFRATGYTFAGRSYENKSDYRHDKIGTTAEPGTGTSGPCVGCHMSRENKNGNHLFLPVGRTGTNGLSTGIISKPLVTITGITSKVCFNASCHGPNDAVIEVVHAQKEQLEEALEAFKFQLEKRGFYYAEAHPYFYKLRDSSVVSGGTVTVTYNSTTVTGSGTDWIASGVTGSSIGKPADRFRVDADGAYYSIASVTDATTIVLQKPYKGATSGFQEFTIIWGVRDPVTLVENAIKTWVTGTTPYHPSATVDTDTTGNTTGKNNMGAAFNFNLLDHDPGAYAHNRYYAKRLIYDSIDWLDDNQMNYSVGVTLDGLPSTTAYKAGAKEYLLNGGAVTPYIAAERP